MFEIVRGVNEGLNTQAVAAIARWKFKPATKKGEPIAVLVNVEVNFHFP
jgi:outer membrane biosynthesis protein TonB